MDNDFLTNLIILCIVLMVLAIWIDKINLRTLENTGNIEHLEKKVELLIERLDSGQSGKGENNGGKSN